MLVTVSILRIFYPKKWPKLWRSQRKMVSDLLVRRLLLVFSLLMPYISHGAPIDFESYKVNEVYSGEYHSLVSAGQVDRKWAESRKSAMDGPVNFAGHYVIHTDGCGGGAICGEILDVKTGKVVESFPNAYYIIGNDDSAPFAIVSKPDSRLLIVIGVTADSEVGVDGSELDESNRQRYYEFSNDKLKLIKLIEK